MIEKSIRRLDNSIHEILDLSRNSRMDFEFKNISVSNLIKNILSDLAHIKGSQNIDISTEINGTDFYCDEKRLKMIFNNLISNAVIYHNPYIDNPFIRIVAEINNEMAHFVINDNGVGIDKNHVQNIFKMFYRANDTTTGSGLGLYIVKEAVEKLKGSIEVESKIGEGTRFEIKIPNKKMNLKA
jgi:signal transduction histidine kinase